MQDHPLGAAARFNDALAEEIGFVDSVKALGVDHELVIYLARQRALHVLAVTFPRFAHLRSATVPALVPKMMPDERLVFDSCILASMDGICIGLKAAKLEAEDG